MRKILDYLELIRFRHQLTSISVVLAAFFFGTLSPSELIPKLLILYVSFVCCLYGGLYTVNAIGDKAMDGAHPTKRTRPIPAGRISLHSAWIFAAMLMLLGLMSGYYFFGPKVAALYAVFALSNVLYTYVGKYIPYFELLHNGITHPLRVVLGVMIGSGNVPPLLLFTFFLLAVTVAATRRLIEKEHGHDAGRPTLSSYSKQSLRLTESVLFAAVLGLSIIDFETQPWIYGLMVAIAAMFVVIRPINAATRRAIDWFLL